MMGGKLVAMACLALVHGVSGFVAPSVRTSTTTSSLLSRRGSISGGRTAAIAQTSSGMVGRSTTGSKRCRRSTFLSSSEAEVESSSGPSKLELAQKEAEKFRLQAEAMREEALGIEASLKNQKVEEAERDFLAFDTNGDGVVDLAELKAGLEKDARAKVRAINRTRGGDQAKLKESEVSIADDVIKELMGEFDADKDGVLKMEEFRRTQDLRMYMDRILSRQKDELREERQKEWKALQEAAAATREAEAASAPPEPGMLNDRPPQTSDKVLSVLPYLLPFLDGLTYGTHFVANNPQFNGIAAPLFGAFLAYRSVPFGGLLLFIGFQWIANQPTVNKLVRFNLRQSINLDIALFLPSIFGAVFSVVAPSFDPNFVATVGGGASDIVFGLLMACVFYSVASSLLGVLPNKIPVLGKLNRENYED